MKRIILLSLTIALSTLWASAQCIPTKPDLPYSAGENLSYTLSYNWHAVQTDVATASLKLDSVLLNNESVYHGKMTARTKPFFDVFFKARENFQSWFSMENGRPIKYTRNTEEGDYFAKNVYRYDWNRRVINAKWSTSKQAEQIKELPLTDCTYDLPSIIYFLRRMDTSNLSAGKSYRITFAIDDDVYTVTLTYKGKENRKVRKIGKVPCLKFGCSVVAGEMFSGNEDAQLWVSDDENHIPIYFMAPLKVGAVSGRLTSASGLAYPIKTVK